MTSQNKQQRYKKDAENILTFSAKAWLHLQYLCQEADTEVGAFGISHKDDLLYIEDIHVIKQQSSIVSMKFNDEAIADFFETQVDQGKAPAQFARIWIHTHPGDSPNPSYTDEETFARVFGKCDWSIMFILAEGGQIYCRLKVQNSNVVLNKNIQVDVDYGSLYDDIETIDVEEWERELKELIIEENNIGGICGKGMEVLYNNVDYSTNHGYLSLEDYFEDEKMLELEDWEEELLASYDYSLQEYNDDSSDNEKDE